MGTHAARGHRPLLGGTEASDVDPVCGMKVNPTKAAAKHEHAGRTHYFAFFYNAAGIPYPRFG